MSAQNRGRRLLSSVFGEAAVARRSAVPGLPVPRIGTDAWASVDDVTRVHILSVADDALRRPWPAATLHDWLGFTRDGDRAGFEQPFFRRRHQLSAHIVGYGVDSSPDRLRAILDGLWLLVEEASWCVPAHLTEADGSDRVLPNREDPIVDLFSAETGALVAAAVWLLDGELDAVPGLADRLRDEVRTRVLDPFLRTARARFWFRQPANWNPWIMSNVMACTLVCARDAAERAQVISLVVESLDGYLDGVPQDGGCPEGIMYWWASAGRLFEALELLVGADTDPALAESVFGDPLVHALARYPLVADLGPEWAASFGDGVPRIARAAGLAVAKELHPIGLIHRFARAVGDPELAAFARSRRGDGPVAEFPVPLLRGVTALLDPVWADAPPLPAPRPRPHWLPEIQVFAAPADRLRLVAKGGRNDEPHNHNDIGSFVLALDGVPVVIDAGSGRYTRDSFREGRYDAWFTTSPYHSAPLPAGCSQQPGNAHAITRSAGLGDDWHLELELVRAFPPAAGLRSWRRRWSRASDGEVQVDDAWSFAGDPAGTAVHLLLPHPPARMTEGAAVLLSATGVPVCLSWEQPADAVTHTFDVDDDLLRGVWGETLTLLRLVPRSPGREGRLSVTFRPASRDILDAGPHTGTIREH